MCCFILPPKCQSTLLKEFCPGLQIISIQILAPNKELGCSNKSEVCWVTAVQLIWSDGADSRKLGNTGNKFPESKLIFRNLLYKYHCIMKQI